MTIALWCVLLAALMPYLWTSLAKGSSYKQFNNKKPRVFLESLEGWGKRADWAQMNAFEAFPPFAAAVIIATYLNNMNAHTLDVLAIVFVIARLLYGLFYIIDKHVFRTIAWMLATGTWVSIFVLSA